MAHHCHATGCNIEVPPEMWGCRKHWFMLPKEIRNRIWKYYRSGQCNDMNPSNDYLLAAKDAVTFVAFKENKTPDTSVYDMFLNGRA